MDMLPPQAPPADIVVANQAAVDTIQRMNEVHRWLAAQQESLPALPDATEEGRRRFIADLDQFWAMPSTHDDVAMSRREALVRRLILVARDSATLLANDGTLDDDSVETIRAATRRDPETLPDHLHAGELTVGGIGYAGAFVLQDDRRTDQVLLFTTRGGWERFPSLGDMRIDVERRFRQELARSGELPGVLNRDIDDALASPFVDVRDMRRNPFDFVVERLIEHHRQRFDLALVATMSLDDDTRAIILGARRTLRDIVDVHDILLHRDHALLRREREERLASYPQPLRDELRDASIAHANAMARQDPADMGWEAIPLSLGEFVDIELRSHLSLLGIDDDPSHIRIKLIAPVSTSLTELLTNLMNWDFTPSVTVNLPTFSLTNIGSDAVGRLTIETATGAIHDTLTVVLVHRMVRDIDVGRRYLEHLDHVLGDTETGRDNRSRANDLLLSRLRLDIAMERKLMVDGRPPASHDIGHLGLRWMQAVVEQSDTETTPHVNGLSIGAHQVTYDGTPVARLFMLRGDGADRRIVIYMPDRLAGRAFREYADFDTFRDEFLLSAQGSGWILDHLPTSFTTVEANGSHRFKVSDLQKNLDFAVDNRSPFSSARPASFDNTRVTGRVADAMHDTDIALARSNAIFSTRTTRQADNDTIAATLDVFRAPVQLSLDALHFIVSTTLQAVPQVTQTSWRFYDHVKAADYTQAFLDSVDMYTGALNVVPLYASAPHVVAGTLIRAKGRKGPLMSAGRGIAPTDTLFEERYIARGVKAPPGPDPADGIFHIDGKRFIRQRGDMYEVGFDTSRQSWRLARPDALDTNFTGPSIERSVRGDWRCRSDIGLLGGGGQWPIASSRYYGQWLLLREHMTDELSSLSLREFARFHEDLIERIGRQSTNRVLNALGRRPRDGVVAPPVHGAERASWNEAMIALRGRREREAARGVALRPALTQRPRDMGIPSASRPPPAPMGLSASRDGLRAVREDAWPPVVYYYATAAEIQGARQGGRIVLPQARLADGAVQGIPVLTTPPSTPLSSLAYRMLGSRGTPPRRSIPSAKPPAHGCGSICVRPCARRPRPMRHSRCTSRRQRKDRHSSCARTSPRRFLEATHPWS